MTGVIGVSSQQRLGRKKEEFMWDELNRILGVNRKGELSSGEPRPDVSAGPEPGTKSGNESDAPGDMRPAELPGNTRTPVPAETVQPQNSPDVVVGDGERWPASVAGWAAILDEESRVNGELAQGAPSRMDSGLPATDDEPATESAEPRPFGFTRPPAARRKLTGRRLVKPEPSADPSRTHKPEQRLLILDCWQRSELPAKVT